MPNKSWRLTRYLFKEQLQYLGWSYLTIIVLATVVPFLMAVLNGTLSTFSWRSHLSGLGLGAIFGFFIFIVGLQNYDNFKLFIQNGISRRTYWLARVTNLLIMSAVGVLLAIINDFAISAPLLRLDVFGLLAHGPYEMYAKFFGDNVFLTVTIYMLFLWLLFITLGLLAMAISSIMVLFSKTVQRLIYIVVPVLAIFLLAYVASAAIRTQGSAGTLALQRFAKWLLGYHQTLGLFNPFMPMMTLVVASLMLALIAYGFNRKLKLRN